MKAFLPLEITDAILTSTTVVETAPSAYAGGTTYALNDTASVSGSSGLITVYKSLQAGNVGNTPASSPTWWQNIGDTYGVYAGGTTYALGDRAIDATAHLVYESLIASNTGGALADTTKWALVGYTNKWAMLKYLRSTETSVPVPITLVITPAQRINSMQFQGLQAIGVHILGTSVVGGGTVYDKTINLKRRLIYTWWDWCFARFTYRRTAAKFDIPPYRDIILTITITPDTGQNLVVGKWGIGRFVYLGKTESDPSPDQRSFSTTDINAYGDSYFTKRRVVPKNKQTLHADPIDLPAILEFRAACDADPAFWYGVNDETHVYADALAMLGSPIQFLPALRTNEVVTTLEIQGL